MAVVLGIITGLAFGFVLQRGRLCFNSAFRDLILLKDNFLFKAGLFAIALSAVGFQLMAHLGWIHLNPKPLSWSGVIIGAFVFGIGMVLAGGCASGTTYRVGEGSTTAWFAAIFYGLAGYATKSGALNPLKTLVSSPAIKVPTNSTVYLGEEVGPTLATLLNVNPWVVAIAFAALICVYLFATKTTERPESPWNWKLIGLLVLPVAMFGFWSSTISGRAYGLGITGGWINIFSSITTEGTLNWEGAEILGIILGALITALITKEFKFRLPREGSTYLKVAIGGILMGFGAVTAGGCNIGHFLSGIPQLAISSIVAGVFFILGNWATSWLMYGRE